MTLPDLEALVSDVRRLLAAGAVTSTGDERLCRRAAALQQLGQKVPVLAQVALAVQRVIEAWPTQATAALLDLLLLVQQIRPSLTNVGVEGARARSNPPGRGRPLPPPARSTCSSTPSGRLAAAVTRSCLRSRERTSVWTCGCSSRWPRCGSTGVRELWTC